MISISRLVARQFRAVARRAGLCKVAQPGSGCMRLLATADSLRLQATNGRVAIEYRVAGRFDAADITVPLQLFADCEAKTEASVTIRRNDSDGVTACWEDRGVPQQHDYPCHDSLELPAFSEELATNPSYLLGALRDAVATVDSTATRYSLDCLQLDGAAGSMAATDSRQLLLQSGFSFPWQEAILMRATGVFASVELPTDLPVEIGRTKDGVTVRVGSWTIHHEIDKQGRYPKLDRTIPSATAIQTRMQVDAADARFLMTSVERLPADDQTDRPLTLELNGAVVVRARKDQHSPMMELLLSRSRRVGEQLRLQTNRTYLARALALGFAEVGFVDAKSPCVCQDATRTYVWMLLENKGALEPSPEALQVDSLSAPSTATTHSLRSRVAASAPANVMTTTAAPINRVAGHLSPRTAPTANVKADVVPASSAPQTNVIEQALELRNQLRTVVQGLNELVTQIRQQRKQTRLMKTTLQSLKQLQLLDA